MSEYPKFEKVDDNTIKITAERSNNVPLINIVKNKKHLLEQKKQIEKTLSDIETILQTAEKLGIVPKEQPSAKGKPTVVKAT